jgi:molybdenum cofactor guanylyltransferase
VHEEHSPIGVVLAGGAGRRLGGEKARVRLLGTPLLCYPIAALRAVLPEVVVVAKRDTELPPLPGVPVWSEPDEPRHPLTGIVHALEQGGGRAVLVCAGDLPFMTGDLVRTIAQADPHGAPAVVPRADGRLQPLLARYERGALLALAAALADSPGRLTDIVAGLAPRVLDVPDGQPFFNVNVPEDLLTAGALLERPETG